MVRSNTSRTCCRSTLDLLNHCVACTCWGCVDANRKGTVRRPCGGDPSFCGRRRMSGGPDEGRVLRPEGESAAFDSVTAESTEAAKKVDVKKAVLPSPSSSASAEAAGVGAVAGSAAARSSQDDVGGQAIDELREAKLPEAVHRRQADQEDTVDDNHAAAGHLQADIALSATDDAQVPTGPNRKISCDATQTVKRRRSMRERNVSKKM
jgi:hypothetical protein